MTEAARKTLEEVNRKQFERLQKKADNKTIGEACDDATEALAVLSGVINNQVEKTDDPVVCMCSTLLINHILETTKAIITFNQISEAAEIVKEQEKNK